MASAFAPLRGKALGHALRGAPAALLPGFLVPAWQRLAAQQQRQRRRQQQHQFSTTTKRPSKLGRTPISIPPGVELTVGEAKSIRSATSYAAMVKRTITIKGPLGTLEMDVPEYVGLTQNPEDRTALLSVDDANVRHQREMWGTTWSYLNNHIMGVSEGHTAILRLVGVGYRATVERRGGKETFPGQKFLCLKLGFTHPVEEGIPRGVTATAPAPTRILLEGPDREVLMSFAGRVRKWRPPEPYKGKGVFINDQTIKLKQKKIK
ncbi:54S ribosomal protein L6 mitochondrial [Purpureocillium takamizusanense]|uniref:54S ribosomal protein L6 mitochondrial n=1 Tax=Purpureocillium takamizusanense TaxID=2060973 RepID=A0A9Q8QG20_9HYPO|nr:54S ribosomal protein L6 mitochondrial [Purpureocillium takamizusanense]UNI18224.1 54S ribosomal protein L6 mitochondrial [Purpureocillium takamizusanense]